MTKRFGVKEEEGFTDNMVKSIHISIVLSGKDVDLIDPVNWLLNDCKNGKHEATLVRAETKIYYTEKK